MDTSVFTRDYFIALLMSLLRHSLTGLGLWFTGNNIGTEGQWTQLLMGAAFVITGAALMVWNKYKIGVRERLGLALPAGTTPAQLKEAVAVKNDPIALSHLATDIRADRSGPTV